MKLIVKINLGRPDNIIKYFSLYNNNDLDKNTSLVYDNSDGRQL